MTVCVAGYGNIGPDRGVALVAASDRMITINDTEFEPEQTKAVSLATQTLGLLAGEMEVHASVFPATMENLKNYPPNPFLVKSIAEKYALEFAFYRRYIAEQEVLMPLGLTSAEFLEQKSGMSDEFIRSITDLLLRHRQEAEAIIAGIDITGAHIYKVIDPGIAVSFDTPCFAAIGVGASHAETYLMGNKFSKNMDLAKLVYTIFAAKMTAEIASSVGSTTDLMIIAGGAPGRLGGISYATKEEVAELRDVFDSKRALDKDNERIAIDKVKELLDKSAGKRGTLEMGGAHGAPVSQPSTGKQDSP